MGLLLRANNDDDKNNNNNNANHDDNDNNNNHDDHDVATTPPHRTINIDKPKGVSPASASFCSISPFFCTAAPTRTRACSNLMHRMRFTRAAYH